MTARHHPIRPVFHKAGRAGRERETVCVCIENSPRKGIKTEMEEVRGSERKPAVLCCAVRCHCEFENLSHLGVAIRITGATGGE